MRFFLSILCCFHIVKHVSDKVIYPHATTTWQFFGDNTDRNLVTVDGKNTHYGLGFIAIFNGKYSNGIIIQALPRDTK